MREFTKEVRGKVTRNFKKAMKPTEGYKTLNLEIWKQK